MRNLVSEEKGEDPNSVIFMLVSLKNCFYVLGYQQYPWNVDKKLIDSSKAPLYQFKGQMVLLTGKVDY